MKQERVILSFIMVLIGLLVAGAAFYFYQSGKQIKSVTTITTTITPTPTQTPKVYLVLKSPQNQTVVADKILNILGQTSPKATVVIITDSDQQVLKPDSQGNFSTTITLANNQNLITVESILPSGEIETLERTVTFSTSNF